MKRIITFVLLGLLIYAGGFVIFYSCRDILTNTTVPVDIRSVPPDSLHDGMTVEGSIYQVIGRAVDAEAYSEKIGREVDTETYRMISRAVYAETYWDNLFSKGTAQYYYAFPYEGSGKFVLLAVSDKEDLEAIKQLYTEKPHEYADGAPKLDIYGVVGNMEPTQKSSLTAYLVYNPEVLGIENGLDLYSHLYTMELFANAHIAPYVIYITHPKGADIIPLIIGIAMCAAGIVLIILLVKRIKDEKESY